MKKTPYGFVYIWFDTRHQRFYVGSHWGSEDDGYICSSKWMREEFYRHRLTFKRRVISRIYTNRFDLVIEEQRWLDMIKREEVGTRYYNRSRIAFSPPENHSEETKQKMRELWTPERRKMWSEDNPMSGKTGEQHHLFGSHRTEEQNRKQAEVMKGREPPNKGVPHTAEANEKNRQAHLGKKLSDEARQAFIEAGRKAMETATPEQKQEWYDASSKRFKDIPLSEDMFKS